MKKGFSKLAEFVQHHGSFSSMRLMALVVVFTVLGVWSWISIKKVELAAPSETLVLFVLGIVGGKVTQAYAESKIPGADFSKTETTTTAVVVTAKPEEAAD